MRGEGTEQKGEDGEGRGEGKEEKGRERGGRTRERRGGLSGNVAEEAFCFKSAPACNTYVPIPHVLSYQIRCSKSNRLGSQNFFSGYDRAAPLGSGRGPRG